MGLLDVPKPQYGQQHDLCDWMVANTWVEPTLYDHHVPSEFTTPMPMYENDLPWSALTWCFDPNSPSAGSAIKHPTITQLGYAEKGEYYMMKSMLVDHLEIGWVCFNDVEGMLLVHHIQLKGSIKGKLNRNQALWLYRYFVRVFVQMVPPSRRNNIVVPDCTTFDQYTAINHAYMRIPMMPFTGHVLAKSRFKPISGSELAEEFAIVNRLSFTSLVPPTAQKYWRYTQ